MPFKPLKILKRAPDTKVRHFLSARRLNCSPASDNLLYKFRRHLPGCINYEKLTFNSCRRIYGGDGVKNP
ncbi:hypothetical protein KSP40_PGU001015 [Platanthera guangdongensis]|uniref:Uncharacterized protein n=1 Tax=Platanthera guangdongensis TaxID=2320717 RepID=A0ABR2LW41_9ASPA